MIDIQPTDLIYQTNKPYYPSHKLPFISHLSAIHTLSHPHPHHLPQPQPQPNPHTNPSTRTPPQYSPSTNPTITIPRLQPASNPPSSTAKPPHLRPQISCLNTLNTRSSALVNLSSARDIADRIVHPSIPYHTACDTKYPPCHDKPSHHRRFQTRSMRGEGERDGRGGVSDWKEDYSKKGFPEFILWECMYVCVYTGQMLALDLTVCIALYCIN